jgi:hypothetical protein
LARAASTRSRVREEEEGMKRGRVGEEEEEEGAGEEEAW